MREDVCRLRRIGHASSAQLRWKLASARGSPSVTRTYPENAPSRYRLRLSSAVFVRSTLPDFVRLWSSSALPSVWPALVESCVLRGAPSGALCLASSASGHLAAWLACRFRSRALARRARSFAFLMRLRAMCSACDAKLIALRCSAGTALECTSHSTPGYGHGLLVLVMCSSEGRSRTQSRTHASSLTSATGQTDPRGVAPHRPV